MIALKALLNTYAESTGLKVNYSKSMMVQINTPEERMNILAQTFGCQRGSMPFTYLGFPLGITKPSVHDFLPMVQKIERRLLCCAQFLTQGGKLEMINFVLTPLPMYRKHLLWRGSDINNKSHH